MEITEKEFLACLHVCYIHVDMLKIVTVLFYYLKWFVY